MDQWYNKIFKIRPLERLEAIRDGKEAGPNSFVVSFRIHRKFVKKDIECLN